MRGHEYSNGWCCVDCLFRLANGDDNPEWSEEEADAHTAAMDRCCAGTTDVSLGRMFGEEGCEHTADSDPEEHAAQCEQVAFTWSACDTCGSTLGGSREAVTFWFPTSMEVQP